MRTFACRHTVHARAPRIIGGLELAKMRLKRANPKVRRQTHPELLAIVNHDSKSKFIFTLEPEGLNTYEDRVSLSCRSIIFWRTHGDQEMFETR
jgi:hypothetical protein